LADVCWIGDFNHRHKHDLAFITIYSSQKLGLPLTAVTSLLSINALTALALLLSPVLWSITSVEKGS
jgi:hypothetical protein